MNILVVAIYDDNFGDMLICTNFVSLLKVALKNQGLQDKIEINQMDLKNIEEEKVANANCIIFAGGGLFGFTYLGLQEYLDKITDIANKNNIPVYFSSTGVVSMEENNTSGSTITEILNRPCVKGITVREDAEYLDQYLKDSKIKARHICDPALWTKYVYHNYISPKNEHKTVGINVVRGGLFKDNGKTWTLTTEMNYLNGLKALLDENNIDYKFYTNGNIHDDNTLKYWAQHNNIDSSKIICVNSAKDLVGTISSFDAIASIRMHSSIIAYSCGVPAICMNWHNKVRCFNEKIGYGNRVLEEEDFTPENVFTNLNAFLNGDGVCENREYMMSVYDSINQILKECFCGENSFDTYTFSQITDELKNYEIPITEDLEDALRKVWRCEKIYLAKFTEVREQNKEIKALNKEIKDKNEKLEKAKIEIKEQKSKIAEQEKEIKKQGEKLKKKQAELDRIYNKLPVKIYRKLKSIFKRGKK